MKKIKYKASWIACIEEYPVESETKNKVIIGKDTFTGKVVSYLKETKDVLFCDTFEEAKEFLIEKHKRNIKELEAALQYSKENLALAQTITIDDVRKDH